jgi:hypothetical protein
MAAKAIQYPKSSKMSAIYNSQMECKLILFQITVIYVKAVATSIMSSFMIYNLCQISHILQRSKEGRW